MEFDGVKTDSNDESLDFEKLAEIISTMKWDNARDSADCAIISQGIKFIKNVDNHELTLMDTYRYTQRLSTMNAVIQCGAKHEICQAECDEIAAFFKEQKSN